MFEYSGLDYRITAALTYQRRNPAMPYNVCCSQNHLSIKNNISESISAATFLLLSYRSIVLSIGRLRAYLARRLVCEREGIYCKCGAQ